MNKSYSKKGYKNLSSICSPLGTSFLYTEEIDPLQLNTMKKIMSKTMTQTDMFAALSHIIAQFNTLTLIFWRMVPTDVNVVKRTCQLSLTYADSVKELNRNMLQDYCLSSLQQLTVVPVLSLDPNPTVSYSSSL